MPPGNNPIVEAIEALTEEVQRLERTMVICSAYVARKASGAGPTTLDKVVSRTASLTAYIDDIEQAINGGGQ